MKERARVVVIGSGLAGAAAAFGLTRAGHRVTLIERERRAGVHASGRNAGMIRQIVGDPAIAHLAREGARLLTDPPADLEGVLEGAPLIRTTGSILLAGGEAADSLRRAAEVAREGGTEVREVDPAAVELYGIVPSPGAVVLHTPSDGIADPHTVLNALLEAARRRGADVRFGCAARIDTDGGRVRGVEVVREDGVEVLSADVVVNAAGPWADELVVEAGGLGPPLISYRRHLFYTGPLPGIDSAGGWVWDTERGFYVRPESAGLLLCACDTDPRPPEDTLADADAMSLLAARVADVAPRWSEQTVARSWAGLRTFAPDERFVIGWDPKLRGLFWLAGLGGHGLTTSCALAGVVARGLQGQDHPALVAFDPARFDSVGAGRRR